MVFSFEKKKIDIATGYFLGDKMWKKRKKLYFKKRSLVVRTRCH